MSVRIKVLDSLAEVQNFRGDWDAFANQHPAATPFHSPAWLLTWWRHFGSGNLHVMVCQEGETILAVTPAFLIFWEGRRQLTLMGSGITDYLDPLIVLGAEERVTQALAEHLRTYAEWEFIYWTDISPDSPLFGLPGARAESYLPVCRLALNGPFPQFWQQRGKDLKRNVRRYRDKAAQLGEVRFSVADGLDPKHIDTLLTLHTKRWRAQGEPGMVDANHSGPFMRDVAAEFALRGQAIFFELYFQGTVAAALFALTTKRRIYGYMSAFDPETAELGFGRLLLYEAIQHSFGNFEAWDFLRGDEPYKLQWGAELFPRSALRLERQPDA